MGAGTVVDGRYRVLSRLGSGGMADVFLAEDQQLGRKVAVKLLHRRFAEDPGFVERFRREAQAAAALQHPNVVGVYDRGSYDDTYYIAMEYLSGRSLKQVVRQEAPLDPVRAIDITIQILKAARFAHRRGVIHRDLKPHNVIIDDAGNAKVTDFGIARAGASDMTETGSIMGTAQYLSPEQAQGHAVSPGSDLYSVGVVLYELVTGRVPFDGESAVTIALKHVSEAPPAPSSINPAVPPELEQVVMWALNKNAADRPGDADQFIAALEHVKASLLAAQRGQRTSSMAAVAVGAYRSAATVPAVAAVAAVPPLAREEEAVLVPDELPPEEDQRGPRWPWIALIIAVLLAAAGLGAYLLTRPAKTPVPLVVGQTLSVASAQLQNVGFGVSTVNVTDPHPAGIVLRQDPQPGVHAKHGSTVTLTVSSGPGNATVPPVIGMPLGQAKRQIEQSRLHIGQVSFQSSTSVAKNHVISTDPSSGATPQVGSRVNLVVSSGPPQLTVPDVTGQPEGSAKATLEGAGFSIGTTTTQTSSTVTAGNVVSQSPAGNATATQGSAVNLVIAKAPPPPPPATATVPNVTGQQASAAAAKLQAAGFTVSQQTRPVQRKKRNGVVLSESPGANSTANKGSTVTIVVGQYTPPATSSTTSTTSTAAGNTSTTTTT